MQRQKGYLEKLGSRMAHKGPNLLTRTATMSNGFRWKAAQGSSRGPGAGAQAMAGPRGARRAVGAGCSSDTGAAGEPGGFFFIRIVHVVE